MSHYRLVEVQNLVALGQYYLTATARQDALKLEFDYEDVRDCIQALQDSHFYKSMPADKAPGLWQDVYKITFEGTRIYLKLQINRSGQAVTISFKEDESFGH